VIRLVLHHARKDLRAVWPWLTLWLALLLVNLVAMIPAVDIAARRDDSVLGLLVVTYLLAVVRVALGMLIVVRVVHADSPAGTTAFWLTRPLSCRAVLSAKLLVIVGLVGLGAVANVAGLLLNGLEPARVPGALAEIALFEAIPLLPLAVVASLTGDTARLVLAGLACFFAFAVGRLTAVNVTAWGHDARIGVGVLLLGLVVFACSLSCLTVQYLARQARRTLGLVGVGLAMIAVVGFVAPFRPERPDVTRPWPEAGAVSARLTPYVPPRPIAARSSLQSRRVYANLDVQGLPPGIVVRPLNVDGTLRFEDGHEARFQQELGWRTYTIAGQSALDRQVTAAAAHAVKADVFHAEDDYNWFMRIPLVATDTADIRSRVEMPGRYEAAIKLVAYRLRLAGVIPARAGAHLGIGSRDLTIEERGGTESVFTLTARLADPALLWTTSRELEFLLVNRARGEAKPGHFDERSSTTDRLFPFYLWSPVARLQFGRALRDNNRKLDDEWFEAAELAVLTIEEEGAFTVRVTMDGLTIEKAAGGRR